jgi:hypothetical protein
MTAGHLKMQQKCSEVFFFFDKTLTMSKKFSPLSQVELRDTHGETEAQPAHSTWRTREVSRLTVLAGSAAQRALNSLNRPPFKHPWMSHTATH